ncbi:MAG: 50S ribosomal protein L3 N(5)-glutamine methyltransferase, partial [Alphaproteobacteria bacterium]|nr:50S ribosomal protein L3 N(5)-glutamine methyltransferase [Alphaproteobacteria bacterium]
VDDVNPWLEARLLADEKKHISDLIEQRVTTRKPAAYLLKRTYMHGVPFYVDERVIIPRSYIGEMLVKGLFEEKALGFDIDPENVTSVLDLCTGSGCLAILAANVFHNASITAADLSSDALDVARINLKEHDLLDQVSLVQGHLLDSVEGQKFDLIITNPPYVAQAEVDAFPPEYAHEPKMAHLGGEDGFELVREIIREAPRHLNKGGGLICEIGIGREILEAEFPKLNFFWLDSEESEGEVFFLTF